MWHTQQHPAPANIQHSAKFNIHLLLSRHDSSMCVPFSIHNRKATHIEFLHSPFKLIDFDIFRIAWIWICAAHSFYCLLSHSLSYVEKTLIGVPSSRSICHSADLLANSWISIDWITSPSRWRAARCIFPFAFEYDDIIFRSAAHVEMRAVACAINMIWCLFHFARSDDIAIGINGRCSMACKL